MRGRVYTLFLAISVIAALVACEARVSPVPTATALPTQPVTLTALPSATTGAPTVTPGATSTITPGSPEPTLVPPTMTEMSSSPTPVPPSPTSGVVIDYFRAGVEVADPGETITLEWRWSGGTEATIYHLLPSGQLGEPWWDVGPSGSLDYTISPQARNYDRFVLFVYDDDGLVAQETIEIVLRCPDKWFFDPAPDICPAGPPVITDGAEQTFQRGVMLWSRAEDRIYVLFDDGKYPKWQSYEDTFDEGQDPPSDSSLEPPAELRQPMRGFGLVWRERPSVRDRLGWAVEPETGYETAIQRTSRFKYNDTYIRALDGGVWRLGPERSEWEHISSAESKAIATPPSGMPAPSAVPTVECEILPEGGFRAIWQSAPVLRAALGCPTSLHPRIEPAAWEVRTAYQSFQHGEMIWSDRIGWYEQPVVYVLYGDGTYQRFEDTYDPDADSFSGDRTPPPGLFEPVAGFGKAWREEGGVRDALGWATMEEVPGEGRFQMFLGGEMVWIRQTDRTYVFSGDSVRVFDVSFDG